MYLSHPENGINTYRIFLKNCPEIVKIYVFFELSNVKKLNNFLEDCLIIRYFIRHNLILLVA